MPIQNLVDKVHGRGRATLDILADFARSPFVPFRFPTLNDRVTINGRTGSGKTVAGAWLLSNADFHRQPFVIVNYKGEKLFNQIKRAVPLSLADDLPTKPGIYHLQPLVSQAEAMEAWLWRVWKRAEIGLFIDEGYLLPDKEAFRTLLTTGRSRQIPIYTLSQRPVRLPRFTISESDFYQCFHLHDARDRATVSEFTPEDDIWSDTSVRLKKYSSRWYDVGEDFSCLLDPVPDMAQILATFERRLTPRQTLL